MPTMAMLRWFEQAQQLCAAVHVAAHGGCCALAHRECLTRLRGSLWGVDLVHMGVISLPNENNFYWVSMFVIALPF
jgi:hypothetical protein